GTGAGAQTNWRQHVTKMRWRYGAPAGGAFCAGAVVVPFFRDKPASGGGDQPDSCGLAIAAKEIRRPCLTRPDESTKSQTMILPQDVTARCSTARAAGPETPTKANHPAT